MSSIMQKILQTIIWISFIICTVFSGQLRAQEQRVALVIGNATYENSPLANPVNDATDMADKLSSLGFDVVSHNNISMREIGSILSEFRSKLKPGSVALVFYAGHGIQIKGENYFPAVDAKIQTEEDVPNQSIAIRQIMDILDESKTRLNLVFLDACRNNPFARSFRSSASGLARVSAPTGTLISYATRPGSVAADGEGRNGLYTSKLLTQMNSSEQIELSLKSVVSEVKAASRGKQEPWMEGSIEGEFCFAGCGASPQVSTAPAPVVAAETDSSSIELSFWDSIKNSSNPEDFRAYLAQYPKGKFESLAHNRLDQFTQATAAVEAPAPRTPPSHTEGMMVDSYTARLSSKDHFNSDGTRLKSVADIIRQDRANYHKFNVRDNDDRGDNFFSDKDNRGRIAAMLEKGTIDNATTESILNSTPVVLVNIYNQYIEVYLQ
ncbi:hypothetical protein BCS42_11910 [Crenothrix sp. D3]|nr:hypothetical protein BCS42_11910 [Crenothrix sp. D3]